MTDLLPGLRRMQSVLPEHGCLLVSPGNYWQNQRERFDSDPDLLRTIQKHEPKGLHTSATLRGGSQMKPLPILKEGGHIWFSFVHCSQLCPWSLRSNISTIYMILIIK